MAIISLEAVLKSMPSAEFKALNENDLEIAVLNCPDARLKWEGFMALLALLVHKKRHGASVIVPRGRILSWLGQPVAVVRGEEEQEHCFFSGPTDLNAIVVDIQNDEFVGFGTVPFSEIPSAK